MRKNYILALAVAALAGAIGFYAYIFLSPQGKMKRAMEESFQVLNEAVDDHDDKAIERFFHTVLADNSRISLTIQGVAPAGQPQADTAAEDFTKPDFIRFVQLILYTLDAKEYSLTSTVSSVGEPQGNTATVVTTHKGSGKARSYMMGKNSGMQSALSGTCTHDVEFADAGKRSVPIILRSSCDLKISFRQGGQTR
jgi:hypothetical protein